MPEELGSNLTLRGDDIQSPCVSSATFLISVPWFVCAQQLSPGCSRSQRGAGGRGVTQAVSADETEAASRAFLSLCAAGWACCAAGAHLGVCKWFTVLRAAAALCTEAALGPPLSAVTTTSQAENKVEEKEIIFFLMVLLGSFFHLFFY